MADPQKMKKDHGADIGQTIPDAAETEPRLNSEQSEDTKMVAKVTAIVREADEVFQRVGGGSRHWVRDCFLPVLNREGLILVRTEPHQCMHCDEDIRQDEDGDWIDRETHTYCDREPATKHQPIVSAEARSAPPTAEAQRRTRT